MKLYICFFLFLTFSLSVVRSEDSFEPVTFNDPKRLLLLDGEMGSVACRIYGNVMSATIPRLSNRLRLESATRSLLRMRNLVAVRGIPGAGMVGPIDYFGNLESPDQYLYTIGDAFPPVFYRTKLQGDVQKNLDKFDNERATVIKARWISGTDWKSVNQKKMEYGSAPSHLKQSLFRNPGFLEIDREVIELEYFDPRDVDLSSFKAKLVNNHLPFQITEKKLPAKDEYRLVSYLYEPGYADWQIECGSGLFLERHRFSQTITPLTPDSSGFVALARTNATPDELELVGIQIPYGWTLIIEEGCIHGDTTLSGFFMMGMTSDHTTMRTADTVFLKYPPTKGNVGMVLNGAEPSFWNGVIPPPYVIYKDGSESDREIFRDLTQGMNFIFNPFSREYWRLPVQSPAGFEELW